MNYGTPYSFVISGNLKELNGTLKLKIPHKEMRTNLWQVKIQTISYDCLENVNILTSISSNLVTDIRYENDNEVYYNPILAQCLIKGRLNDKKCEQMQLNWFYINNFVNTISLEFRYGKLLYR